MDYTPIIVAIIAAGPVYLGLRKNSKLAKKSHTILEGNGKGNVMVMLETLIDGQARHEADDTIRFAKINRSLKAVASQAVKGD